MFHFVSLETPSFWSPPELERFADTSQEESSTFIKNWSVRNQINPSWKSLSFSRGHREVAKYTAEKLRSDFNFAGSINVHAQSIMVSAFKFGHHAIEGIDTIITSLVLAVSYSFLS